MSSLKEYVRCLLEYETVSVHKRHSFAKFSSLCSHGCCGHAYIVDERHHGSWWSHPERSSVEGHFSQMIINCKYPNQPNTREVSTSRQFCARKTTASLKATSSIFQTFSNCIKFTARPNPGGYTIGSESESADEAHSCSKEFAPCGKAQGCRLVAKTTPRSYRIYG